MTKTMTKTMSVTVGAILTMAVLLPAVSSAQPKDFAQPKDPCGLMVQKSLAAKDSIDPCKAADVIGGSSFEMPLDNIKISQPIP